METEIIDLGNILEVFRLRAIHKQMENEINAYPQSWLVHSKEIEVELK